MAQDPTIPSFVVNTEQQIHMTISPTDAAIAEQGYTYNQSGFTYNQPGWMYGGLYRQNQDLAPVFANDTASLLAPSIVSIIDVGVIANHQKVVGPGWFMYVSQQ